jgi:hypothetical protein
MAPTLTLHHGENKRKYEEHPMEVARRALCDAADLEEATGRDRIAASMRRVAESLPVRDAIMTTKGGE